MEPRITINGIALTIAQVMTVRVAIESFAADLADDEGLGTDEHGLAMTRAYRERINELRAMVYNYERIAT